ncbi:MAG: hypothetical protein C0608_01180 [Deltaproteobacteria bacterium]|nr:MAG: hypothetical protein C0608_01180 [Deltaproteobacteria bacterium]
MAKAPKTPRKKRNTHLHLQCELDGNVVGHVARKRGRIRWGAGLDNEITYPIDGAGESETLVTFTMRGPELHLKEGMEGELTGGYSTVNFADLDVLNISRGRGKKRRLLITRELSGWFEYRGARCYFSYGLEIPEEKKVKAPRQRVPLRFRRPLLAREDWVFTLFSWSLYGLLALMTVYLASVEIPAEVQPEKVAARFAKLVYEAPQAMTRVKKELEAKKKADEEAKKEAEEVKAEEVEVTPEEPEEKKELTPVEELPEDVEVVEVDKLPEDYQDPDFTEEPQQSFEERREAIRKEVSKKGLLGVLGGRGGASTLNTRSSVLEGGGRAEDLDKVLENVEGLKAAPAETGTWKGKAVEGANLDAEAGAAGAAGSRRVVLREREATEVTSEDTVELDDLSMKEAVAIIHRTVDTYLGGIRYLYNRELRKNPELEGKVTVAITIDPEGNVKGVEVVETTMDAPALVEAMVKRIKRWTFPQVAPKDITVTYPFVFFPSM